MKISENEKLRKLVAFYQGESIKDIHPIEAKYLELVAIECKNRTEKQKKQLIELANILHNAVTSSETVFYRILDFNLGKLDD